MIDNKWLGETSIPHPIFFLTSSMERLGDRDPYFFYIRFSKDLYSLLGTDFQSISELI